MKKIFLIGLMIFSFLVIACNKPKIVDIRVEKEAYLFENFKLEDVKLFVVFNDNNEQELILEESLIILGSIDELGENTIKVKYEKFEKTLKIVLVDKFVKSIVLKEDKDYYLKEVDTIKLVVTYMDDSSEEVLLKDLGYELVVGVNELNITYKYFSVNLTINVFEDLLVTIAKIELKENRTYYLDEVNSIMLVVTYLDDSSEEILLKEVSGNLTAGTHNLSLVYEEFSFSISIKIIELVEIEFEEDSYIMYKNALNYNILKLVLIYSDASKELIDITPDMISGLDNNVDTHYVMASYKGLYAYVNIEVKYQPDDPDGVVSNSLIYTTTIINGEYKETIITLRGIVAGFEIYLNINEGICIVEVEKLAISSSEILEYKVEDNYIVIIYANTSNVYSDVDIVKIIYSYEEDNLSLYFKQTDPNIVGYYTSSSAEKVISTNHYYLARDVNEYQLTR